VKDIVIAFVERVTKFINENPNYGAADTTPAGGNGKAS
jgi:hypothetical protein